MKLSNIVYNILLLDFIKILRRAKLPQFIGFLNNAVFYLLIYIQKTMEKSALSAKNGNPITLKRPWGLLASINLYGCDPVLIREPEAIRQYVIELCGLIDMKRFGEALIQRFAEGYYEGVSLMQFIETSSVTAHFDEQENRAFIDIFSCKFFDSKTAAEFSRKFFKASKYELNILTRD